MCNVIMFRFTCQHTLRLRRSRCKGTKHKVTRTSIKAACTAESFLTISLRTDCGPCQHETWESGWKLKLERAKTFLQKLSDRNMPGTEEITALVKDLETQYTSGSWEMRNRFAQAPKPKVARVGISDYRKERSPLLREVRPEDVVEGNKGKTWAEMEENDYDGNYIASTDPIHPISTDYSHPFDDDDGSWIMNHLSPEELESSDADVTVDFDGSSWSWGNDATSDDRTSMATEWVGEVPDSESEQQKLNHSLQTDERLMAWGPDANATPSSIEIHMNCLSSQDNIRKERGKEVINAFWAIVNSDLKSKGNSQAPPPPSHEEQISHLLDALDISKGLNTAL